MEYSKISTHSNMLFAMHYVVAMALFFDQVIFVVVISIVGNAFVPKIKN